MKYRRGVFVVDPKYMTSTEGATNFFDMIKVLGGPKLLPVRSSTLAIDQFYRRLICFLKLTAAM